MAQRPIILLILVTQKLEHQQTLEPEQLLVIMMVPINTKQSLAMKALLEATHHLLPQLQLDQMQPLPRDLS